ncbi:glycosyltransferase family 2 protein, partial [Candidatus Margulisiibacteriota bacterium]
MSKKPVFSVVVPIFKESDIIESFYLELSKVMDSLGEPYEIIFSDDQTDVDTVRSVKRICDKDKRVILLSLSRNFGHQVALSAGIDHAQGDAVIMLDGDFQHPPQVILQLVDRWKEGYDIAYTIRKDVAGERILKKLSSRWFYKLMDNISDVDMGYNCADFRLISRKVVDAFMQLHEKERFIRGLFSWMGFRKIGIPFKGDKRKGGKSKYSLRKLFKFAINGVLSFSDFPLKIITVIGIMVAFAGFIYITAIIISYFYGEASRFPGWASILGSVLLFSGVQIIMLGIIGEYLGKTFTEVKNRPL